ncbi:MAG TPA: hypothetical protein VLA74_13690 [Nitrososphaeraceae archaeon]|nr:hypothetical protein [Nitrososphaeraceae archaeon]
MSLLFEIEKRLKEKNIFRVSLSDLQSGSTTGKSNNALLTIGRHESNIKSEIYPQTDFEKTDSRMIVLKGRYFTVEIKYKKAESFPSSLDFMPNDIDPEIIKQILTNNFCANSSNTKVITFTIEFDATVNTLSRIRAFFSFGSARGAEQEIKWLNELQRDFKQFFSIIDFSIIDE